MSANPFISCTMSFQSSIMEWTRSARNDSQSRGGEIGRRASLRSWFPQGIGGSSPLLGTTNLSSDFYVPVIIFFHPDRSRLCIKVALILFFTRWWHPSEFAVVSIDRTGYIIIYSRV